MIDDTDVNHSHTRPNLIHNYCLCSHADKNTFPAPRIHRHFDRFDCKQLERMNEKFFFKNLKNNRKTKNWEKHEKNIIENKHTFACVTIASVAIFTYAIVTSRCVHAGGVLVARVMTSRTLV